MPTCLLLSICTFEPLHECGLQQHCLGMRRVRHLALLLPEECPALLPLWRQRWLCRSGLAAADCGCGFCLSKHQSAAATVVTRKAEPRPATLPLHRQSLLMTIASLISSFIAHSFLFVTCIQSHHTVAHHLTVCPLQVEGKQCYFCDGILTGIAGMHRPRAGCKRDMPHSPCSTSSGGGAELRQALHPTQCNPITIILHRRQHITQGQPVICACACSLQACMMRYLALGLLRYPFP